MANNSFSVKIEITKSLLFEGVSLTTKCYESLFKFLGKRMEKGDKEDVTVILNEEKFPAILTYVNFKNAKKNTIQLRYVKEGDLSKKMCEIFKESAPFAIKFADLADENEKLKKNCKNFSDKNDEDNDNKVYEIKENISKNNLQKNKLKNEIWCLGEYVIIKGAPHNNRTFIFECHPRKIHTNEEFSKLIPYTIEEFQNRYYAFLTNSEGGDSVDDYVNYISHSLITSNLKKEYGFDSIYSLLDIYKIRRLSKIVKEDTLDTQVNREKASKTLIKYSDFIDYLIEQHMNGEIKEKNKDFSLETIIQGIKESGLIFNPEFIKRYVCSLLTKRFVILTGLTGSGKTQLAMAFPKMICQDRSQYKLIPVGADWTNREPLLGYPNALRSNEYVMPDNGALQLIIDANKNPDKPYFLLLDEMNMSYVERYFADFLSAMESGEDIPLWSGNDKCDIPASIKLPKNLFIIGTINVDETTYMFSPKVLDRANVIEFRIGKEQMKDYLTKSKQISPIEDCSDMGIDFVEKANANYESPVTEDLTNTLLDIFDELSKIQKEFGYRTAHEMSRYMTIAKTFAKMEDDECLDSAIVQKLLPKIHGSRKKVCPVLNALWKICYNKDVEIESVETYPDEGIKYPLTAEKIWRMFQIAQDNGFTSFAEA